LPPRILVGLNYPPRNSNIQLEEGAALPLCIAAYDVHDLVFRVTGQSGGRVVHGERRYRLLASRLTIRWEILPPQNKPYSPSEHGEFVGTESDAGGSRTAEGEQVLYRPPNIQITRTLNSLAGTIQVSKTVRIKVTIIHDDPTKEPLNHQREVVMRLRTTRRIRRVIVRGGDGHVGLVGASCRRIQIAEDNYMVRVAGPSPIRSIPRRAMPSDTGGENSKATWMPGQPFQEVSIQTGDLVVGPGEKVQLVATGRDRDRLRVECTVGNNVVAHREDDLEDYLDFLWSVSPAEGDQYHFPGGNRGRAVVFTAPRSPRDYTIQLVVTDFQNPRLGGGA